MGASQRVYKKKIQATSTLEKVFRAMELIAASRIGKARKQALGADPYTKELTAALAAVAVHAQTNHPLVNERTDTNKVIVFVITSDRGMAGAYSASVLREADGLLEDLRAAGKEPILFVFGRRGESHYSFMGEKIEKAWTGESDKPSNETALEIAQLFLARFLAPAAAGGVAELHVVSTRFESMVRQTVEIRRMLPLVVVDEEEDSAEESADKSFTQYPLYEFEPSAQEVFDALLPLYVSQRIHSVLLMAAASELASRQRAMQSATDNARELINDYVRRANNARQAEITTEITEIVSGADALAGK
ncbi:F0F1 ATP synthase subunit gamma [uncultured Arcanobacterium sp.]|uniref:F0F1 ATP synthase subunit gamma n=1 Tax=uncultured Arcanobacterium sp. TaxID=487520 RepID=UPI00262A0C59|nr:F0F1 ATP synthase subunit gamma [uncultured Arcanobacterium sp.]